MAKRLIEIPSHEWIELRNLYINYKSYASAYNFLQNIIEWITKDPNANIVMYALNGEWRNNGTFIAKMDSQYIICNTLSDSGEHLLKALNCLDKTQLILISGYQERIEETVREYFLNCNLKPEQYKPDCTVWVTVEREIALHFNIEPPKGLQLKNLTVQNAEQINNVWPHRGPNTINFIQNLINYNDNIGVFNAAGQLVAWCLITPLGSLGVLQVVEEYRRQGLGQLVVRYMSRLIANKGLEVTAPIIHNNVASRKMFEKLGFKIIDRVFFVQRPTPTELL